MSTVEGDVTAPAPGIHGPADTTDPTQIAHTVSPRPGKQALATGTVNAIVTHARVIPERDTSNDRYETYPVQAPNGSTVIVRRNIETGVTEIVEQGDTV